ncbi:MAG: hypothetical protein HQL63_14365 [Magnetococcales bacterium]|nr:hypothetical protein [Magnetococcales bacterium]
MPNTVELLTPDQLSTLVGKSFSVQLLGGGKASVTPLAPPFGGQVTPAKVMLNGVEVEGLRAAQAAAQQATAAKTGAGVQTMFPAKIPVVEIEGAGKTVGTGKALKVLSLETRGTMQAGSKGAIDLFGGEAKIAPITQTAPAKVATPVAQGAAKATAQTVAMVQTVPDATGGSVTKSMAIGGALAKGSAVGLSLSVWGSIILAGVATVAVGVGVYNYLQRR